MAVMVDRAAPNSGLANLMAMKGRYGDTELVHMSKPEIAGLASLGQLTVNPETGLPEAFNLKSLLPVIGGIAGSILLPGAGTALGAGLGASAVGAGLGTFGGGLLAGQKPGEALFNAVLGGAMSYGIGSALGTTGVEQALKPVETALPTGVAESSIPAATQGLAGQAGQAYGGFDALSGVGEFGGFGYDALPPAGSMVGVKDVAPKTFLGFETAPAVAKGQVYSPTQLMEMGITPSTATTSEIAKATLTKPTTYAPLAAAALTGGFNEVTEAEPLASRPAPDTGYGSRRLVGGELITPPKTAAQIQEEMLYGGYTPRFTPYRYAASGGLVGLQAGGMPVVQQQPSAMQSAMAPQTMQQPVMMQQPQMQPQQQQQQMMAPLPQQQPQASTFDPTSQFMKMMDLQEQVDTQKNQGALAGLLGTIASAASTGQQGVYNQPNGQMPQLPKALPTNYGSQVNLGLNEGGMPSKEYFEGRVEGNGDGMSDGVEFEVDSEEIDGAMLSPDEYVLPADVVAMIGNGSSDAGADKLDMFVKSVRKESYGTEEQQKPYDDRGLAALVA